MWRLTSIIQTKPNVSLHVYSPKKLQFHFIFIQSRAARRWGGVYADSFFHFKT
jgi:hypothetical protein